MNLTAWLLEMAANGGVATEVDFKEPESQDAHHVCKDPGMKERGIKEHHCALRYFEEASWF